MICSLYDLKKKEVIDINTGAKLGYIDDVEINTETEAVLALMIFGRPRFLGIFGRDEDIMIECSEIKLIGEDTILVSPDRSSKQTKRKSFSLESLYK